MVGERRDVRPDETGEHTVRQVVGDAFGGRALKLFVIEVTEDLGALDRWQHTFHLNYEPIRWLEVGVGYRLSVSPDEEDASDQCCIHRPILQIQGAHKIDAFKISLRLRGQLRVEDEEPLESVARARFKVTWKPVDIARIYVSTESFWGPDDGFEASQRFDLGARVAVWEGLSAVAFARYEYVFEDDDDTTFGLSMRYSF